MDEKYQSNTQDMLLPDVELGIKDDHGRWGWIGVCLQKLGDFFLKMDVGIIKFPIKVLSFIFRIDVLKALCRNFYRILRVVIFASIWFGLVFAAWIFFAWQQFLRFWRFVFNVIYTWGYHAWEIIFAHIGPIWFFIALAGSIYGLMYVTLYRRKKKKKIAADENIASAPEEVKYDETDVRN